MEIARLFGVLPHTLLRLPLSEFRLLMRYYNQVRAQTEKAAGGKPSPGPNDTVTG
jgi:hypothetical protein